MILMCTYCNFISVRVIYYNKVEKNLFAFDISLFVLLQYKRIICHKNRITIRTSQ